MVRATVDAMVSGGFVAAGYKYLNRKSRPCAARPCAVLRACASACAAPPPAVLCVRACAEIARQRNKRASP